jgi:hypothetical protein
MAAVGGECNCEETLIMVSSYQHDNLVYQHLLNGHGECVNEGRTTHISPFAMKYAKFTLVMSIRR